MNYDADCRQMKLAFFISRLTPFNSLASMKMICHKSKENHNNNNKKLVNLVQNNASVY